MDQDPCPSAHAQLLRHDRAGWFRHDPPHHARSVLAKASRRAVGAAPGVDWRAVAVYGHVCQVLTAITARASLLAVGKRGAARFPDQSSSSVAVHLASCARCPVVFVPAASAPVFREIVVGTDGSDDAALALEFGFGEADTRHARLTALHVWSLPQTARIERYPHWMLSVGSLNPSAAASLAEQVGPWRQKYPEVVVTEDTVHGQPGRVLTTFSSHADLVVTAGGRVGLGLALGPGSVADALLPHAQCPVAVIPNSLQTAVRADHEVLFSA